MKLTVVTLIFLLSSQSFCMEFVLNCRPSSKLANKSAVYQVVKSVLPSGGKWVEHYQVRAMGPAFSFGPKTFETKISGGDEDYNEYEVIDPNQISGLQAIYVQNRFAWATLINNDGDAVYSCKPNYN